MPVFFQAGFRPFFLFAGLAGLVLVPWWTAALLGALPLPARPVGPVAWHAHEMLYGFIGAAVAGFLLTATPNWTNTPPRRGWPIVVLAAAWLLGRGVMGAAPAVPAWLAAVVDLAAPALLLAQIAHVVLGRGNRRNYAVPALLAVWVAGDALYHAAALGWLAAGPWPGLFMGIYAVLGLMLLISGRVGPAFTAGHINRVLGHGARAPATPAWTHSAWPPLLLAVAAGHILGLDAAAGVLAVVLGLVVAWRMTGWRTAVVLDTPIVWVLHLGHAWLAVGFVLLGLGLLADGVPRSAGLHALLSGGAATLVLAVMSRAALGHTGRIIHASPLTVAAYALVTLGAVLRVAAAFPAGPDWLLHAAATAWPAAFLCYLVAYAPLFFRPRLDGRPG